ncbi:uncharacterized protein LOC133290989 [Gastrolobium bilobum]|uniref:uncharacterized protein LOC133290989 n=1 Tax=Gastrolobium bilobum TaxID=150636 RepID=UPI002AB1DD07|nr:uncharacterized protein LOC133290989 [Gastrolobium bilobum]
MNSSALCSLLVTLCLILISHSPLQANAKGRRVIGQVCKEALEDRAMCMTILRSDPRILHSKNYVQLSNMVLQLALNKGIEGQNFLKQLALTNISPAISQCANFDYDGVVESFKSALGELKDDPQTANYDAKVAGDGTDTCERGLAAAHIVNPAISALNREILLLSKIAFLATNKL